MTDYPVIPVLQIREKFLLTYQYTDYPTRKRLNKPTKTEKDQTSQNSTNQINEARSQRYRGILSSGAIKRMKLAIDGLVAIAEWKEVKHPNRDSYFKFKINFITLTLPAPQGKITDKEINRKALQPFLERLKDDHPGISYVWKAEAQENGNIHYHIATDRFTHHSNIKDNWNQKLKKWHFIKDFAAKHGHSNPNSTDVHSTRGIKDFAAYMIKYMTKKDEGKRKLDCKLWDCSDNLKTYKRPSTEITYQIATELQQYIDKNDTRIKTADQFSIVFIPRSQWKKYLPEILEKTYQEWVNQIRTHPRKPPDKKVSAPAGG